MKKRTFLIMTVAVGMLSVAAFDASAQNGGGGGGFGGGGFGGGAGGGRGGRGGILTQEQTTQMRDAMQGSAEMTTLSNKLAVAQKAAIDAALASDATEASVRPKLQAVADVETEIAVLRYNKAVKPIVSSVTTDQKTRIDETPGIVYNQLFGAQAGFGGRGGAGGGRRGGGGGGFGGGNNN